MMSHDPREAAILAVVAPWRSIDVDGRTAALAGWAGPASAHASAPADVLAAIRSALPMPVAIAAAAIEDEFWRGREADLRAAGVDGLDLAVAVRAALIRVALEQDLPAESLADVRDRFAAYQAGKGRNASMEATLARDLDRLLAGTAARPAKPNNSRRRAA